MSKGSKRRPGTITNEQWARTFGRAGALVECPRGHEYDCEKDDVCPRCLDDADKWMDAERDA